MTISREVLAIGVEQNEQWLEFTAKRLEQGVLNLAV